VTVQKSISCTETTQAGLAAAQLDQQRSKLFGVEPSLCCLLHALWLVVDVRYGTLDGLSLCAVHFALWTPRVLTTGPPSDFIYTLSSVPADLRVPGPHPQQEDGLPQAAQQQQRIPGAVPAGQLHQPNRQVMRERSTEQQQQQRRQRRRQWWLQ
jgi:hypothetical protein